jgi:glycosyltransferase involved in cell wall biosynthesis
MKILFVHQYFPGQFKRIARHYVETGHDVVALHRGIVDGRSSQPVDGVRLMQYGQEVVADRPDDHILHGTDTFVREAASACFRAIELRDAGWFPDLVYDHSGWGTGAFLQDVFPDAKYVKYCEWFHDNSPDSIAFLEAEPPFEGRFLNSLMNLPILADLARADLMIAPTAWQKSKFPASLRQAIEIAPDGIDTDLFRPDPDAVFKSPMGRSFTSADRVITYVARGADPFRGFRPFIEALGILQAEDPAVEALIVGDRKIYYDGGAGKETHFDDVMTSARIDPARTHFTGTLPYDDYRKVLQLSAAHVYLTVPFVLSWSALEALSTGCAFVGSDTPPVREFVADGENGLLADFFDAAAIAGNIRKALKGGPEIEAMREKARSTILEQWSASAAIDRHVALVSRLLPGALS